MEESLLAPALVAEMTGLTTGARAQLRYLNCGPDFYPLGPRTIRYARFEVQGWIHESRASTVGR